MARGLQTAPAMLKIPLHAAISWNAIWLASACAAPNQSATVEDQWATLVACGLSGVFAVNDVAVTPCTSWPKANEQIEVARRDGAIVLRFGAVTLPVTSVADCALVANGCEATEHHYFAPTVTFRKRGAALTVSASANDIQGSRYGQCHDAVEFQVSPVAACAPVGKYPMSHSSLTTGACNLTWSPGEVEITQTGGVYAIQWGSVAFHTVAFDEKTCTFHAEKGTPNSEFWSYNGALRSATLDLTANDGTLQGTVNDQLMGATATGQTCSGATFAISAQRPQRETRALEAACAAPPPDVCGDGICAASETCDCSDCACQNGTTCTSGPSGRVCARACTLASETRDCPGGQKCGTLDETRYPLSVPTTQPLHCIASGGKVAGQPCSINSECSAGLVCHLAVGAWAAECAPPCGVGLPTCNDGRACGPLGLTPGGTAMAFERNYACEREVGRGGDCHYAGCSPGLYCQKSCTGAGDSNCNYVCIAR